jgi:hypothetical protein
MVGWEGSGGIEFQVELTIDKYMNAAAAWREVGDRAWENLKRCLVWLPVIATFKPKQ